MSQPTHRLPLLEVRGIHKHYGAVHALADVSLAFAAGEVHAILGENGAGKSTLMRIVAGEEHPDAGEILLAGERVRLRSPLEARALGIGMVHQHFTLVDALSVWENLALALSDEGEWRLAPERVAQRAQRWAERLGFELPALDEAAGNLPVGARQRLEILKALVSARRVLILDEPTAVLTPLEVRQLFAMLRQLKEEGRSILFITHKLAEVAEVADRVSILRQGRVVGTFSGPLPDLGVLAQHMVGERLEPPKQRERPPAGTLVLELAGLGTGGEGMVLRGVSLGVRRGEIVGIAGVDGNGQRELFEVLAGLGPLQAGEIRLAGRRIAGRSPAEMLQAGMGFVPPDRQREGLVLAMTVAENVLLHRTWLERFSRYGFLQWQAARSFAQRLVHEYRVRAASLDVPVQALSGGNQQRLILARELAAEPKVLVAVNPTRGLDFAATRSIWEALQDVAGRGCAVLLVSTDLEEILACSDRVVVLYRGQSSRPLERPFDTERLARWMAGVDFEIGGEQR